jgi:YggT family protein
MNALFWLIDQVIGFYITLVIVQVVLSWLVAFNVINTRNRFVYIVGDFLYRVTEPALKPIRRLLPSMGGIDLAPVVLILALYFLRVLLTRDIMPAMM